MGCSITAAEREETKLSEWILSRGKFFQLVRGPAETLASFWLGVIFFTLKFS
jgi:hypothetical protein